MGGGRQRHPTSSSARRTSSPLSSPGHLATAAERKAVKAADARLVARARKLARHHDREPWAWAEYMKRVPTVLVVDDTSFQPDVAQQEAETAAAALGDDLDALPGTKAAVEDLPDLIGVEADKTAVSSASTKPAAHITTVAELRQQLAGTKWEWNDKRVKNAWFTLNADGTVTAGWHKKPGTWVVTTPSTIVAVIMLTDRTPENFDVDLAEATLATEHGGVHKIK